MTVKFLILSGNPKTDGLCHSVQQEIIRGATEAGADVQVLTLEKLSRCQVCGNGWGTCRENHTCVLNDNFADIQKAVAEADQLCLLTPVYWGETAEAMKGCLDRLRRCHFGQNGILSGKPVLLVASPGGSGNGALTCLDQMDRFCRHTGAVIYDHISVNRWNNDYKKQAAYAAAKAMAGGRKAGESL